MSEEKKGNGHDPLTVQMVELLQQIAGELGGLRGDVKATNERLDKVDQKLDAVIAALTGLAQRTEVVASLTGRVDKLEAAVFKKPTRPARRAGARR